jgi:FKBP-type peptidyl-prolyl cis-trans isomerase FklB
MSPASSARTPMLPTRILAAALLAGLAVAHPGRAAVPAGTESSEDADFMRRMAAQPGVKTLPSGLEYKVLQSGDPHGTPPKPGDELVLNYDGKLPDGATFDSTEQQGGMARMPFQGLIPGWMEGLQLMRPGDVWMLYIPSRLGYGDKGQGPIPPNSPLVFKIELVAVHPAAG